MYSVLFCTFGTDDVWAEKVGGMPRQFQPLGLTAGDAALTTYSIKQVKIVILIHNN